MKRTRFYRLLLSISIVLSCVASTSLVAAEKKAKLKPEDYHTVEMFEAMKSGDIQVEFIPKDAKAATVIIHNKSDKPLSVKLPEAFAGVPVLAQFGGGVLGGGGPGGGVFGGGGPGGGVLGGGPGGGGGQGLGGGFSGGGGFGGGGLGGGGFAGGGGFFNVEPEKVGKIRVETMCLEHGKDDPSPRMKYVIRPLETLNKDPRVAELCKMLARGDVPQNTAQAAAWHLANGLSWEELASKDRYRSQFTGQAQKFFSKTELDLASRIVSVASARVDQFSNSTSTQPTSPGFQSPGETFVSRR